MTANLAAKLADLAVQLLDDALNPADVVPTDRKIDIFKAVSSFHLGATKLKPKKDDGEESGAVSMDVLQKAIAEAEAAGAKNSDEEDLGL